MQRGHPPPPPPPQKKSFDPTKLSPPTKQQENYMTPASINYQWGSQINIVTNKACCGCSNSASEKNQADGQIGIGYRQTEADRDKQTLLIE